MSIKSRLLNSSIKSKFNCKYWHKVRSFILYSEPVGPLKEFYSVIIRTNIFSLPGVAVHLMSCSLVENWLVLIETLEPFWLPIRHKRCPVLFSLSHSLFLYTKLCCCSLSIIWEALERTCVPAFSKRCPIYDAVGKREEEEKAYVNPEQTVWPFSNRAGIDSSL